MKLHELKSTARTTKKRVGRGNSANCGTTAGRGTKGQNSRGSGKIRIGFEGGQTPLLRRIPKLKGFKNPNREPFLPVNLEKIETVFSDSETVSRETLISKKIIRVGENPKILARGEISKKLTFSGLPVSAAAIAKIEKSGGKVETLTKK
jgi:large subunit ribosomal protein L15